MHRNEGNICITMRTHELMIISNNKRKKQKTEITNAQMLFVVSDFVPFLYLNIALHFLSTIIYQKRVHQSATILLLCSFILCSHRIHNAECYNNLKPCKWQILTTKNQSKCCVANCYF